MASSSHRVSARFAPDDETPIMPPAAVKSRHPLSGSAPRQVDLTQEAEDPSLASIMNNSKAKFPEPTRMPPSGPEASDGGWEQGPGDDDEVESEGEADEDGFNDPFSRDFGEEAVANAEKIKSKKLDLLNKLYRLGRDDGVIVPSHLSIRSPLDEIEEWHSKITHDIGVRKAIRLQRRALMGFISSIELANEVAGGPDELKDVSRTMFTTLGDFDAPFTEMYERYGSKVNVHPGVHIIMLTGSIIAQHCYARSMSKHQTEQERANTHSQAGNDPQRAMREMEQRYLAEERARAARVAEQQAELQRSNEQIRANEQRQRQAQTSETVNAGFNAATQGPGSVVTPSAFGLQQQRPPAQMVPPPLKEPAARPAPGEYVMRGPMSGVSVGSTPGPMPVPVGAVLPIPSNFQALPQGRSEPSTPNGAAAGAKPPRKRAGKKKDADDVSFN